MANDEYISAQHPIDPGLMELWLQARDAQAAGDAYQAALVKTCPHKVILQTRWGRWQQCANCGAECEDNEPLGLVAFAPLSYIPGSIYLDVDPQTIMTRRYPPPPTPTEAP